MVNTMIPRLLALLPLVLCLTVPGNAQPGGGPPFRQSGTTLVSGSARFQFLSPTLVRMEFSPQGRFTDTPTAVVLDRDASREVTVKAAVESGWLVASGSRLTVRYRAGSGPFSRENLKVLWKEGHGEHAWAPGDSDRANLGALSYSLDGAQKGRLPAVPQGLLSRSGYFLLDDSRSPVWDTAQAWIAPRPQTDGQDWYLFAGGASYKETLKEYARLCGPVPMVPRYTLGAWVTDLNYEYVPGTPIVERYRYSDRDIMAMINRSSICAAS